MYGGYGGKNADSPSERGGRFGGGGLGSPSKSASKSSNKEASRSVNAARSDTPSSNRSKGGLGTASKASKDTASKASVGSSVGSLAGRTRMGSVERASTPKSADRTPATGFSLQGRTRMESVTRPARSPGFENKSSVPARSVPTQSFTPSSPASTVPQSVMDRTGFATSYPTGFDLKGRTRMSSMGDMATARAADRRSVAGYSGVSGTAPATKGFGASVGDMDLAQQRRATENQSMADLGTYRGMVGRQEAAQGMLQAGSLNIGGKFGMTESFVSRVVDRIVGVESAGKPNAKNPNSSATGLGQFTESTWIGTLDKYKPEFKSLSRAEKLAMRTDPDLSRQMTAGYALDNAAALQAKNISVTPESLYAAHFLGPAGAVAAYKADPKASALSVLGAAAVNANASIMRGKTIGDVLGYVDRKMAGTIDDQPAGGVPTSGTPGTPNEDYETTAPEMAGDTVPEAPADQSFPAAPTPPRNVLNLPKRAPKPTARDAPPYKRSGLGTVMAGGLDLLSSMGGIPALVGQGLSFVTTGKSLGENVVDYVSQNENYFQPGEGTDAPGYGDPERLTADYLSKRKKAAEKRAKAEEPTYDFVEKYIEFENTSGRPTPEQKWDWRSSKYIGVT